MPVRVGRVTDEWNQKTAYPARIIVISVEANPQRLFLDADSDAEQVGEEGHRRKPPPRSEHERGTGDVEERAEYFSNPGSVVAAASLAAA